MFSYIFRKSAKKRNKKQRSNSSNNNSEHRTNTNTSTSNSTTHCDEIDITLQNRIRRMEKFKSCCKKFTSFFFSRVGLCFLVVGYVVVGGFIFQSIEGKNESTENFEIHSKTDNLIQEIWNMSKYEILFHEANFTHKIRNKVHSYQRELVDAINKGYKGEDGQAESKWTYPGSILYAITIITTIGYGHITCKTATGKIATILYAIIGIPMMLLCLANIGSSMANTFRFIYAKLCCGYCNYVKRRHMRMKAVATLNNGHAFNSIIGYNQINKLPLTVINTAGSNSTSIVVPNNNNNTNSDKVDKQLSVSIEKHSLQEALSNKMDVDGNLKQSFNLANSPITNPSNIIDILDESNKAHVDYRKITVPISVTLFILTGYIVIGASLFSAWENWSFLEGAYFSFITLSTIGLGDYVPGNSIKDTQAEEKLVLCSFYLLMGLSLIAMCFNLMQEEVTAKFRRLAVRLGIIDDPNYW